MSYLYNYLLSSHVNQHSSASSKVLPSQSNFDDKTNHKSAVRLLIDQSIDQSRSINTEYGPEKSKIKTLTLKTRQVAQPFRRKQKVKTTTELLHNRNPYYVRFESDSCLQHIVELQEPFESAMMELSVLEKLLLGLQDKQNQLCVVCGQPADGHNYGALTCKSCCLLFRRFARKPGAIKLCAEDGKCHAYGLKPPHCCKSCHFRRCLNRGMTLVDNGLSIYDKGNFISPSTTKKGKSKTQNLTTVDLSIPFLRSFSQ